MLLLQYSVSRQDIILQITLKVKYVYNEAVRVLTNFQGVFGYRGEVTSYHAFWSIR